MCFSCLPPSSPGKSGYAEMLGEECSEKYVINLQLKYEIVEHGTLEHRCKMYRVFLKDC